jgi:hypothetical protein
VAVRRLVLEFSDLVMPFSQLSLFTWEKKKSSREINLQKVLDSIRMKFGKGIIAWALKPVHISTVNRKRRSSRQ